MAEQTDDEKPPPPPVLDHARYATELKTELDGLQLAQTLFPTEYKQRRIDILKGRLGIPYG